MYMSGAPLHVLAMNLVQKFRERMPEPIPISFSGGLDAHNVADGGGHELRPGHHLHGPAASRRLRAADPLPGESGRRDATCRRIEHCGVRAAVSRARAATCTRPACSTRRSSWPKPPPIRATRGSATRACRARSASKLWLYDCINCDKCVPVCPNDANFVYETRAGTIEYDNFELLPGAVRRVPGGVLRVMKAHQLANYADACNECGNCDIFCPEEGGPQRGEAALLRQPARPTKPMPGRTASISIGPRARFTARWRREPYDPGARHRAWTLPGFEPHGRRSGDPSQRQRSR